MSRISHHGRTTPERPVRRRAWRGNGDGEPGYILVTFALLFVPLLLMVGLSVDVGSWYNRASDIQKAADAASLAGVVWLPDVPTARAKALEAAARNGFVNGSDDITITVTPITGQNRRLKVAINDAKVGSFFYGGVGGHDIDLKRSATAEYILPVPLGSPENTFGGNTYSDPTIPAASQANLWGNIHGVRTDNFKGDAYAAGCRSADNCGAFTNTGYRPEGYLYTIDVPAGVQNMDMQVFDAGLYDRGSNEAVETGDRKYTTTGSTSTTWTFYDRDLTELDVTDNVPAAQTGLCGSGGATTPPDNPGTWNLAEGALASTFKGKWQSICKRSGSVTPGRYLLRVQSGGNGSAANRYALRVLASSTTKPRISAYGDMSMYNNVAAGNASFYLAEVDQVHRGKTLELSLYDPGEVSKTSGTTGDGTIQILAPNGSVAATCGASANNGSVIASVLTPCQFQSAVGGSSKFNGSWVTLQIPIPTGYTCTSGTLPGCWWKVKYIINGQGNDTTTWSAQVKGDPVHLVEN